MADLRDVPPRPTWNCGHPVSPSPTLEEARRHVEHATLDYLDQQYAAHAECALVLGSAQDVWWCREYRRRRWLIQQMAG
jgi:hypothetical protein